MSDNVLKDTGPLYSPDRWNFITSDKGIIVALPKEKGVPSQAVYDSQQESILILVGPQKMMVASVKINPHTNQAEIIHYDHTNSTIDRHRTPTDNQGETLLEFDPKTVGVEFSFARDGAGQIAISWNFLSKHTMTPHLPPISPQ